MLEVYSLDIEELDIEEDCCSLSELETTPQLQRSSSKRLSTTSGSFITVSTNIGRRDQNLDTYAYSYGEGYELMAIFDGHGNATVSNYLATYLLETLKAHPLLLIDFETTVNDTFQVVDNHLYQLSGSGYQITGGSTAIVTLVTENEIFVANLGDSKAISLSKKGQITQLNNEHTLQNEIERRQIVSRGGTLIRRGNSYRLNGEINISRSFGDFKNKPAMSSTPEIQRFSKHNVEHIIMGSDGFWNETNLEMVRDKMMQDQKNTGQTLMEELCKRPSDNATVICWRKV